MSAPMRERAPGTRRRDGTKATQGINGEAAALQRFGGAVMAYASSSSVCPYPGHRGRDWRLAAGGPVVCGVCHPPARGLAVIEALEAPELEAPE